EVDWAHGPHRSYARAKDREILSLAVPAVASSSMDPLLSIIDTYWVSSRLGTLALASLGPALNVDDWVFEMIKTIQIPVRSMTSEAMASGSEDAVRRSIFVALCLSLRVGLIVAVVGSLCCGWLLRLAGVGPGSELFEPARAYLVPRLWGTPGLLVLLVLQAALSGAFRSTGAVLRLVLLGAAVNAALTPALVVHARLGTAGAALATVAACYVMALAAWRALSGRGSGGASWVPPAGALGAAALLGRGAGPGADRGWSALLRANAALTVRTFASITTWLAAGALVAHRAGTAQLAAHLCATKVLVSADVARGAPRHARWVVWRTLRFSVAAGLAAAATMWWGRAGIAALLTGDPSVAAEFGELAMPAATMLLQYGVLWILDGTLYGLGDYVWLAGCVSAAASASVVSMCLLGRSARSIWWCLNVLTLLRSVAVCHRVFFDSSSPLAPDSRRARRGR
ncbi:unnamed protein product, partial [Prorocentrum cordatum]